MKTGCTITHTLLVSVLLLTGLLTTGHAILFWKPLSWGRLRDRFPRERPAHRFLHIFTLQA